MNGCLSTCIYVHISKAVSESSSHSFPSDNPPSPLREVSAFFIAWGSCAHTLCLLSGLDHNSHRVYNSAINLFLHTLLIFTQTFSIYGKNVRFNHCVVQIVSTNTNQPMPTLNSFCVRRNSDNSHSYRIGLLKYRTSWLP